MPEISEVKLTAEFVTQANKNRTIENVSFLKTNKLKLIEEIESNTDDGNYQYFDHFLAALTNLLGEKELCQSAELEVRSGELAARPHGHDH